MMTTEYQIETLKMVIEKFKDYIKNGDHSQEVTQEFILSKLVPSGGVQEKYVDFLTDKFDSFRMLDYGMIEVVPLKELYFMLQDFELELDSVEFIQKL